MAETRGVYLCFDCNIEQVYRPGPLRDQMVGAYGARGFQAGAFLSARGVLDRNDVEAAVETAGSVATHFAMGGDQPFLNYCVDRKQLSVRPASGWSPSTWAAVEPFERAAGAYRLMDARSPFYGQPVPFIHWAGLQPGADMPHKELFLRYRVKATRDKLRRARANGLAADACRVIEELWAT